MKIEKRRLPEVIEKKVRKIQDNIKQHCKSAHGEQYEVTMTCDSGYYRLWVGERLVLYLEGEENFCYALIGFEQGLKYSLSQEET